ncbi:branched-chain amino acid ABC transporter permease [Streptomyces jeddahensis]|uniref:High-affinity branched-chain amino acid transport system permease protein LivH n=1 Tax=Streptomyces jeddahensis TaxID=1716141 RepID=A0A177HQR5_9ACTN|nr:ABC transporter permease [Streptomyces jeddahensis]OAH13066.1 high-affinity branched-chain amino acid transport system permease protein LivH [Streptomyces jeddahensis]
MNDVLSFVVIGITTGSVYGLAAMGLVLTYKTSGIFNFAHGAIAAVAAFAYYELHVVRGLPRPVALAVAVVVVPPVIALVMERVTRGLAGSTPTTKIVATVGLQLALTMALVAHYGGSGLDFPAFLPTDTVELAGINVGVDQLISASVAAAGALGFFLFFRISPMGVKMRAVVDDPALLALCGTSAFTVRAWAWLIGCWFAAVSGVLLAPQIGLDALLLTLLVVQAYGAAAVGFFSSLPLTYAGGLLIGVLAALATKVVSQSEVLSGLPPALPFLVLFAVLLLAGRGRLLEVGEHRSAPPSPPLMSRTAARVVAVAAVAVAVAVPFLAGTKLPVYSTALVFVLVFSSLHLLVRTSGQVSLAHAALVAVGASAFSHLAVGAGLPWAVAVVLAGAVAVPVGVLVAVPAIRLSGLYLALATFGLGLLLEKVVYGSTWMFGATGTLPATRPALLAGDTAFYYVLLAAAVAGSLLAATIGRSRLGRLLRAMADSPTTLSTLGLGVNVTRVTVFAISAFIAGIAGALHASQGQSATSVPFTSYASLTWLAILVLCSGLRSAAPVAAAVGLVVVPAYITNATVVAWQPVLFGLGALAVAIREAQAAGRRGGEAGTATPAASRAGERLGSEGPAAQRLRVAAATGARRAEPGPARVRLGAGLTRGASR